MKNRSKIAFALIFVVIIFVSNLTAKNRITAEQYDLINKTSTSLQELIYDFHDEISQDDLKFIFDFECKEDGSSDDGKDYKSSFETTNGFESGKLGIYKLKTGIKNAAIIGRQLGVSNTSVNPKTHDYVFMGRGLFFDDSLDLLIGANMHEEPVYETINGTKYFTDEDSKIQFKLASSIRFYGVNLSSIIDKESQKTILSYNLRTDYGNFTPKVLYGDDPYVYYDSFFTYETASLFEDYNFNLKATIKHRTLEDKQVNQKDGVLAQYVEIEQSLFILKVTLGYSNSQEFTQKAVEGTMIKVGLYIPKSMWKKDVGFYFGSSRNYYPDLADTLLIDQETYLFGTEIHF